MPPGSPQAIALRHPKKGLVHHSDRGCQYTSAAYQELIHRHGLRPSMNWKGDCWDNAVAESFLLTLKTDLVYRHAWRTLAEAQEAIAETIHRLYNTSRRHSSIWFHSPTHFERLREKAPVAA